MSSLQSITESAGYYLDRLTEAAPCKLAVAALAASAGWLSTPGVAQAAIWLLIADWVTGVLKANIMHRVNSDSGVRGAVKTLIYLSLLWVGWTIGRSCPSAAQVADWLGMAIIYTEAVSNLENLDAIAAHYQADIPILKRAIGILRMKADIDPKKEEETCNG